MHYKLAEFLERTLIQQEVYTLAGRQLTFRVLLFNSFFSPSAESVVCFVMRCDFTAKYNSLPSFSIRLIDPSYKTSAKIVSLIRQHFDDFFNFTRFFTDG
jgi:hypothetical protein